MKNKKLIEGTLDKLAVHLQKYSDLDLKTIREMINHIPVKRFKKGDLLFEQGMPVNKCYFMIEGCARKFSVDEDGKEVTSEFFVEYQGIVIFSSDEEGLSPFSVSCNEESVLIVGDLSTEQDDYEKYPELADLTRRMMEESMGKIQDAYASFIRLTSEERVKRMMQDESDLFNRVPKHQIASYLGITPESLSRITRRLERSHLKIVD